MNGPGFNQLLAVICKGFVAAGEPAKVASIDLARRLLAIVNAMVRD